MRISDWSSDVCSSDLADLVRPKYPSGLSRAQQQHEIQKCEQQNRMRNIMFDQSDHAVPPLNSRQVLAASMTIECKHSRARQSTGVGKRGSVRVDFVGLRLYTKKINISEISQSSKD